MKKTVTAVGAAALCGAALGLLSAGGCGFTERIRAENDRKRAELAGEPAPRRESEASRAPAPTPTSSARVAEADTEGQVGTSASAPASASASRTVEQETVAAEVVRISPPGEMAVLEPFEGFWSGEHRLQPRDGRGGGVLTMPVNASATMLAGGTAMQVSLATYLPSPDDAFAVVEREMLLVAGWDPYASVYTAAMFDNTAPGVLTMAGDLTGEGIEFVAVRDSAAGRENLRIVVEVTPGGRARIETRRRDAATGAFELLSVIDLERSR